MTAMVRMENGVFSIDYTPVEQKTADDSYDEFDEETPNKQRTNRSEKILESHRTDDFGKLRRGLTPSRRMQSIRFMK